MASVRSYPRPRHLVNVGQLARMWTLFAAGRVRSELQYRTSFVLMLVGQMLASGIELIALAALFSNTRAIAGWTAPQVLWLFMITSCAFGLADIFASQVEELPDLVRTGRFDSYLLRPVPVLLAILGDGFELRRIGRLIPGVVAFIVMLLRRNGLVWS